jgi:hypothetical protein
MIGQAMSAMKERNAKATKRTRSNPQSGGPEGTGRGGRLCFIRCDRFSLKKPNAMRPFPSTIKSVAFQVNPIVPLMKKSMCFLIFLI